MQTELKPLQREMLRFMREYIALRGYPPTIRDIVKGTGQSSTSTVSYHLDRMAAAGYIERDPGISRGIRLVEDGG